jgi:hypothetical protein
MSLTTITARAFSVRRAYVNWFSMPFQIDHSLLVNDNDELASRTNVLLVRMCGVTPPRSLINPLLDAIFEAIQTSPVRSPPSTVVHSNVHPSRGEYDSRLCLFFRVCPVYPSQRVLKLMSFQSSTSVKFR